MSLNPSVVWAWLIRATKWHEWYQNCKDLKIVEGKSKVDLSPGSIFTWKTFGMKVTTQIKVFEPFTQLAWRGSGLLGTGYHVWLIQQAKNGCRVTTEEVQNGFVISIGRLQIKRMLLKQHQNWLIGLSEMPKRGLPH